MIQIKNRRAILLSILLWPLAANSQIVECGTCVGAYGGGWANCDIDLVGNNPYFTPPPQININDPNYVLVFEDDFISPTLDMRSWNYGMWDTDDPDFDYTTSSSQYAGTSGRNVVVQNGLCYLYTTYEPGHLYYNTDIYPNTPQVPRDYKVGEINTDLLFGTGKFEMRAKIPNVTGAWPSFWLYAFSNDGYCNHNQEIDVFEIKQNDIYNCYANPGCDSYYDPYQASKRMILTYHYKEQDVPFGSECAPQQCYITEPLVDDFHTYTLIWDNDWLQWYLDGHLIRKVQRYSPLQLVPGGYEMVKDYPSPALPMRIKIANGISQDVTTLHFDEVNDELECGAPVTPSEYIIDWVRVYQKDCENVLNLEADQLWNNQTDFRAGYITVNNSPTSTQWVENSGEHLRLTGSESVLIKNFKANAGSHVFVSVQPCGGQPIQHRMAANSNGELVQVSDEQIKTVEEMIHSQNVKAESAITILPNPNAGVFQVSFDAVEDAERLISVYDLSGRLIYSASRQTVKGSNNVSLQSDLFSDGIYFLRIEGIDGAQRFVVQKQ